MDVRLLEAFRAVVDHRSVTNAAAAMGVTQPAVSAQIARLEQELGFSLFDRSNGRLKPTAEGMLFYAEANRALTGIDRLAQAAEQIRDRPDRAARDRQPPQRCHLAAAEPGLDLSCRAPWRCRAPAVAQLRCNQPAPADRELRHRHSRAADRRDRSAAVALSYALRGDTSAAHELAARKVLTPAILSGHSVVAPSRTAADFGSGIEGLRRRRRDWAPIAEAEYFASVCGLVASGAGWSIVDPLSAQTFKHLGLVVRDFEPAIHYEIGVFCAREREPSILAQSFLAMLTDKLNTLDG